MLDKAIGYDDNHLEEEESDSMEGYDNHLEEEESEGLYTKKCISIDSNTKITY
jgi:hypothetical protein